MSAPRPRGQFEGLRAEASIFQRCRLHGARIDAVADFSRRWNWGYDGVLPFAIDRSYGTRRGLARARRRGSPARSRDHPRRRLQSLRSLRELSDRYAEPFFDTASRTPWGAAVNFAEPNVRAFFLETQPCGCRNSASTACVSTPCTPSRAKGQGSFCAIWRRRRERSIRTAFDSPRTMRMRRWKRSRLAGADPFAARVRRRASRTRPLRLHVAPAWRRPARGAPLQICLIE